MLLSTNMVQFGFSKVLRKYTTGMMLAVPSIVRESKAGRSAYLKLWPTDQPIDRLTNRPTDRVVGKLHLQLGVPVGEARLRLRKARTKTAPTNILSTLYPQQMKIHIWVMPPATKIWGKCVCILKCVSWWYCFEELLSIRSNIPLLKPMLYLLYFFYLSVWGMSVFRVWG